MFDGLAKAVRDMKDLDARGAMIYGIGIDVLKVGPHRARVSRSTASASSRIC